MAKGSGNDVETVNSSQDPKTNFDILPIIQLATKVANGDIHYFDCELTFSKIAYQCSKLK